MTAKIIVFANEKNIVTESAETAVKETVNAQNVSTFKIDSSEKGVLTTEEIVQKVMPSVVGIKSEFELDANEFEGSGGYGGFGGFRDFGDIFGFGDSYGSHIPQENPIGTGTGVVISEDGYVVTNAHVIYDSVNGYELASEISVLHGDDSYIAEVIGYDVDCDLAVLKIEADGHIWYKVKYNGRHYYAASGYLKEAGK